MYIFTYIHKYLIIYEIIYVVWGEAPEPHRRCGIYKHNLIDWVYDTYEVSGRKSRLI